MKRIYLGLWLMAGMANSSSAELTLTKSTAANREILIRVSNANNIPGSILLPAQGVATRILAQAGIQVRWVRTADSEPATEMNGCRDRHLNVIDMAFVVKAQPTSDSFWRRLLHSPVVACAFTYFGIAYLMRIPPMVRQSREVCSAMCWLTKSVMFLSALRNILLPA